MNCFRLLGGILVIALLSLAVWLNYADPSTIPLSVVTGLFGIALGFGLVTCKDICDRKREFQANLVAVKAEFEYCGKTACTFLADDKKSPLYRLPTLFFEKAFPSLLSEGLLLETEIYAVIEYFAGVETLNRGLDQANAVLGSGDENNKNPRLDEEHSRNHLKAKRLIPSGEYYAPVAQALNRLTKPRS
jgi:hypothetical protein